MAFILNPFTAKFDANGPATSAYAASVSNSDGTLTISPTTGAVVASVNTGAHFEWSGEHTFLESIFMYGMPFFFSAVDKGVFYSILGGNGTYPLRQDATFLFDETTDTLAVKAIQVSDLIPGRAVISVGSGELNNATTTSTELNYLSGATSNIQTQITTLKKGGPGFTAFDSVAVTTGKVKGYITCPYSATITAWSISVDAGTATVKVWKIAAGSSVPTIANVINISGVSIGAGTSIRSTTVADFTTTTVTANDIFAFDITAISGVTEITFGLELTKA